MGSLFDPAGLLQLLTPAVVSFLLVVTRLTGMFLSSPFFSAPQIPLQVKTLTVLMLALIVIGPIGVNYALDDLHWLHATGLILSELLIGLCVGLMLTLVFSGIEMAGRLFGIQMGFAVANVVDPTSSEQIGVLSQLIRFVFLFVFFAIDGHLMLIQSVILSFKLIPMGQGALNVLAISDDVIQLGSRLFMIALKIAMPISCTVLLINTGLAALARTNPQMNIFMIGFMLNIGAGLLILGITIPTLIPYFQSVIMDSFELIGTILREL
jgi:flagellar biosynthetic protein FliR